MFHGRCGAIGWQRRSQGLPCGHVRSVSRLSFLHIHDPIQIRRRRRRKKYCNKALCHVNGALNLPIARFNDFLSEIPIVLELLAVCSMAGVVQLWMAEKISRPSSWKCLFVSCTYILHPIQIPIGLWKSAQVPIPLNVAHVVRHFCKA